MRRCKQIGLAVALFLVMVVAPYPDGQSVSHPPLVMCSMSLEGGFWSPCGSRSQRGLTMRLQLVM